MNTSKKEGLVKKMDKDDREKIEEFRGYLEKILIPDLLEFDLVKAANAFDSALYYIERGLENSGGN